MNEMELTIGLEVHAELKTRTKMFCNSINDTDEKRPNFNVCPVCMGHPGTLPVINKEAVRHVLRVGAAVGGKIADYTEFDRKNYFYPDIPKGYQISQYKFPLVSGGILNDVKLTRVHLEEDTAKSFHSGDISLVDFNRSGTPLMELVTEPCIKSAKQAVDFAKELRLLLRTIGASDANMEKGEMRVEANISVAPVDANVLGTKVEVKNLNSFRAVERAIEFELDRQSKLIKSGVKVIQETRGWDDNKQVTYSQRGKEDSHDYRYFPDPDLPKLVISEIEEFSPEEIINGLPELPKEKRLRFTKEYGIKAEDIETLISSEELLRIFEEAAKILKTPAPIQTASNYITSDLIGLTKSLDGSLSNVSGETLAEIVNMILTNKISSRGAKDILAELYARGGKPQVIAQARGLIQQSDKGALKEMAIEIIADNQKAADEYKSGKFASLMFLVGQGMKKSKGSANPEILKSVLEDLLK